jgi:hypothetical protein
VIDDFIVADSPGADKREYFALCLMALPCALLRLPLHPPQAPLSDPAAPGPAGPGEERRCRAPRLRPQPADRIAAEGGALAFISAICVISVNPWLAVSGRNSPHPGKNARATAF